MVALNLPSHIQAQLYAHPVYVEQCKQRIELNIKQRAIVPDLKSLQAKMSAYDYANCQKNAAILLKCAAESDLPLDAFILEFFHSAIHNPELLRWHITIALQAHIDINIINKHAQTVYTHLYMIQYWDQIKVTTVH